MISMASGTLHADGSHIPKLGIGDSRFRNGLGRNWKLEARKDENASKYTKLHE